MEDKRKGDQSKLSYKVVDMLSGGWENSRLKNRSECLREIASEWNLNKNNTIEVFDNLSTEEQGLLLDGKKKKKIKPPTGQQYNLRLPEETTSGENSKLQNNNSAKPMLMRMLTGWWYPESEEEENLPNKFEEEKVKVQEIEGENLEKKSNNEEVWGQSLRNVFDRGWRNLSNFAGLFVNSEENGEKKDENNLGAQPCPDSRVSENLSK